MSAYVTLPVPVDLGYCIVTEADYKSTAVCILGMHRSGTSSVARAMNLLGVYLGEEAKVKGTGSDNPEGFWEHREILDLQTDLLKRLNRSWNTAAPLPAGWQESDVVRPFKEKLSRIIVDNFSQQAVWGWKDPRTCLLLPLWRDLLGGLKTKLLCLFVVRNPIDVASSLSKREPISFGRALGIWFNYCIVALKDGAGLPTVFLSYDQFLASWEPELRRCTAALGLDWPKDEQRFRESMLTFLRPDLHHNKSTDDLLQQAPQPVQELYRGLIEAGKEPTTHHDRLQEMVDRLYADFHAYASASQGSRSRPAVGVLPERFKDFVMDSAEGRPPYLQRTWRRWQRSFRKRFKTSGTNS
jgi:hypothetical protein